MNLHFIEPMYALAVQNIPEDKEWLYEVKFDGYRCLAGRDKSGVTLWSRRGNLFTSQFPISPAPMNGCQSIRCSTARLRPSTKAGEFRSTFSNIIAPMLTRYSSMRSTLSSAGIRVG